MSIQIVTCMGRKPDKKKEPYYILDQFLASCSRFKFTPVVLGEGPGEFNGLLSKAKLLKKAIETGKITADHVIFTDSFDVVFAEDPHKVVELFEVWKQNSPIGARIVWNAEKNCFPKPEYAELHPKTVSSYKYLNSGWGVGDTEAFMDAFKELDPDSLPDDHQKPDGKMHHSCDQTYWQERMLFGSVPIGLDNECELCWPFHDVKKEEILLEHSGKIKNIETGSYPLVMHFNGGSKNTVMPAVLRHLRYP